MPKTGRDGVSTRPASVGNTVSDSHGVLTLRTAAWLADYAYVDQEALDISDSALAILTNAKASAPAPNGKPTFLDAAVQVEQSNNESIRQELQDKSALLSEQGLVPVQLPAIPSAPGTFHAELYRFGNSANYVLVFRGSTGPWWGPDWITDFWAATDFNRTETPFYTAALQLGIALSRQKIRPILVGHSLGAGLAQYVSAKLDLDAVGFNSAPLPARYMSALTLSRKARVRMLSAVEIPGYGTPNQSKVSRADPISLDVPKLIKALSQIEVIGPKVQDAFKGHYVITEPECVVSSPNPYLDKEEDQQLADAVLAFFYPSALQDFVLRHKDNGGELMDEAQRVAGGLSNVVLKGVLSNPVFQPRDASTVAEEAAKLARKRVADQFEERLNTMEAAGKMMQRLGTVAFGSSTDISGAMRSTSVDLARGIGSAELKLLFMAHMQDRFARGMQADTAEDVFTASVTTADCTKPDVATPTLLKSLQN